MGETIYRPCVACRESTRHTEPGNPRMALCRDLRCRRVVLGEEEAMADSVAYLTEPMSKEQP